MVELVRHMSYSAQIAEALDSMRAAPLAGMDREAKAQRLLFIRLLHEAREQSRLISSLSVKLRLTPQAQTVARDVARERARTPAGRRPWEFGVVAGGAGDDDDDNDQGPATN
jgi:hypothetical protein